MLVFSLSVYFGESILYFYSVTALCEKAYFKKKKNNKFLCRIIQSTIELRYSCNLGELCNCGGSVFNSKRRVGVLLVN